MYNAKEFLKLKRQIDKLLKEVEENALAEGQNIASNKFNLLLENVKKRLLEKRGIDVREYEELERITGVRTDNVQEENLIELWEDIQKSIDSVKEELGRRVETLLYEIDQNKTRTTREDVIGIAKSLIPQMPEIHPPTRSEVMRVHNDFDHLEILESIDELEKGRKELSDVIRDELGANGSVSVGVNIKIDKLRKDFDKRFKKVDDAVSKRFSAPLFSRGLERKIEKKTQEAIIEPLRRLAMGLQGQMDGLATTVDTTSGRAPEDLSAQCDGSETVFATTYNISSIDWLSLNGSMLIESHDFTKTGDREVTLSTVAPDSGEELYIKYRR